MGQKAPRVCTQSSAVQRLEALINRLPGNARVAVEYEGGEQYRGIVCVRPSTQAFVDKNGTEGINAVLRLEDAEAPGGEHRLWLDQVTRVHRLDGISGTFEG